MTILEGCQGKPQVEIMDKICPRCGHEVEIFSIDTQAECEHCGFVIYNDTLNCVQWCKYARECVGDRMYEAMMKMVQQKKERIATERKDKEAQAS